MKTCIACKVEKDLTEFYRKSGQASYQSWCKPCYLDRTHARQRGHKRRAVELMGSKCAICQYDKCISALELHHLDPATKDPKFSQWSSWSWPRIEIEIAGCVLLCANCHREVEAGYATLEG